MKILATSCGVSFRLETCEPGDPCSGSWLKILYATTSPEVVIGAYFTVFPAAVSAVCWSAVKGRPVTAKSFNPFTKFSSPSCELAGM